MEAASDASTDEPSQTITLLKDRLTEMFRAVPDILAAGTIEEKLRLASETLTGAHFFHSCTLYLEDVEQDVVCFHTGMTSVPPIPVGERYRQLFSMLGEEMTARIVPTEETREGSSGLSLLVPMKNHEGRTIGIAELLLADDSLCTKEMLALLEVFLMETAQSVEQFQLERELEKSEATYRSLIDNVSDVIFQMDPEGRITFISRQIFDLMGLQWKEVLGKSVFEFIVERDIQRVKDSFGDSLSGRPVVMDLTLLRPDGREVVVFVSTNPIKEGGTVIGILGIARDVTEKRRLEEQIRRSEKQYRALTENAYDAILLLDPETMEIVDVNPQVEHLTGYSRNELLSMTAVDLRQPGFKEEIRRRIDEVMRQGPSRFEDTPLIRKDGLEVNVDTAASVYEVEGKAYYQAILRDISAHKNMREALRRRIMELQILSEVSDALQSAVDLQSVMGIVLTGVTAGKGFGFNRAFILSYDKVNNELRGEAGLGPKSAEEAGKIWSELQEKGLSLSEILDVKLHAFPREADEIFEYARNFVITLDNEENVFARAIRNREILLVDRSAEDPHLSDEFLNLYTPQEFAVAPLVTRDDVMGVLLVDNFYSRQRILDEDLHRLRLIANSAASAIERSRLLISLERRLHELTLINQDLKASRERLIKTERLSAIGEVAASVAHEIRNPLTAIGGFARSIFSAMSEDDKNRRKVEVILEETDRLEHMLSSLLEFTRPAVPRFTNLDLNALILQTVHFMGTEIDPSAVQVVYQLDPNLPRAWADSQQMRQVLLNIVRNALQEMAGGGSLTFMTIEHGGEVQISIRDSGPGIPPENMEKIFEAFFSTKPAGSGLGLAICSQIIRNHNGRLEAFSRPKEGATFLITLPIAQKPLDSY
ncbi:PAS domain S-box protein [candidate division KSB1 bacterium]|nr:MAG: PAS domain S-box protein [candidate division KSB1 bacterium]